MDAATRQAHWGAASGASRWGLIFGLGSMAAQAFSPLYRGLTLQFKVFLWMAGPIFGGMLEADSRLRRHELEVRARKRAERDERAWERYERGFEERAREGAGEEGDREREG